MESLKNPSGKTLGSREALFQVVLAEATTAWATDEHGAAEPRSRETRIAPIGTKRKKRKLGNRFRLKQPEPISSPLVWRRRGSED